MAASFLVIPFDVNQMLQFDDGTSVPLHRVMCTYLQMCFRHRLVFDAEQFAREHPNKSDRARLAGLAEDYDETKAVLKQLDTQTRAAWAAIVSHRRRYNGKLSGILHAIRAQWKNSLRLLCANMAARTLVGE
jgi:hypothetical protein